MMRIEEGDLVLGPSVMTARLRCLETGQRISDYIIPGGRFTQVFAKLAASG